MTPRLMVLTTITDPLHDTVAFRVSTVQEGVSDYETAVFSGLRGFQNEVDSQRTCTAADALDTHNELVTKWTNVRMRRRFGLEEEVTP